MYDYVVSGMGTMLRGYASDLAFWRGVQREWEGAGGVAGELYPIERLTIAAVMLFHIDI